MAASALQNGTVVKGSASATSAPDRHDLRRAWQLAAVLVLANLLSWFVFFRVEAATVLAGAGQFALNARPDPRDHHRAALRLVGCALCFAGAFDWLDIAAQSDLGDWFAGALTGTLLLLPSWLIGLALGDRRQALAVPTGLVRLAGAFAAGMIVLFLLTDTTFATVAANRWAWALAALVSALIQSFATGRIDGRRLVMDALAFQCCVMGFDRLLAANLTGIAWGVFGAALAVLSDRRAVSGGAVSSALWVASRAVAWFTSLWFGLMAAFGSQANEPVSGMVAIHDVLMPLSEKSFGKLALRDVYLWPEAIGKDAGTDSPRVRGVELRHSPKDRFSGRMSAAAEARGDRYYGVDTVRQDGRKIIAYVSPHCAPAASGFRRGYIDIGFLDDDDTRHYAYREDRPNTEWVLENVVSLDVPRENCTRLEARIFEWDGRRVGYLVYPRFHGMFDADLRERFAEFREAGIDELVLDLRYNPGGSIAATRILAGLIAGERVGGKPFLTTRYPARYADATQAIDIPAGLPNRLGLARLIVLTTNRTCSASEALINGLRPYLDVVTVGGKTCGKPVGFSPLHYRDSVFHIAEFEVVNARGQGGYFDGIEPTCAVEENFTEDTGTMGDPVVRAARSHIMGERCGGLSYGSNVFAKPDRER